MFILGWIDPLRLGVCASHVNTQHANSLLFRTVQIYCVSIGHSSIYHDSRCVFLYESHDAAMLTQTKIRLPMYRYFYNMFIIDKCYRYFLVENQQQQNTWAN